MKTYSIYSGKGGVGKSTLSVNLAAYFATKHNLKVCVVDEDEQKTLLDVYGKSLLPFDVVSKPPLSGYDIVIKDHHPTHDSIKLGDVVVCPICPSRFYFESYKRARAVIGSTPHILVINKWSARIGDDVEFITKERKLCLLIPPMQVFMGFFKVGVSFGLLSLLMSGLSEDNWLKF